MVEYLSMEPHPVPQNIIDVEFKLFGSFSLRQFAKIFIGCVLGVVIYLIEPIPGIIRLLLIFISVFGGILMAIVPRFDVMVAGFVKALFISPRYVWIRELRTPEILELSKITTLDSSKKVSSGLNAKKIKLEEVGLGEKENDYTDFVVSSNEDSPEVTNTNFERVYGEIYANTVTEKTEEKLDSITDKTKIKETLALKTREEYIAEIARLKEKLSKIYKEPLSREKEEEIMGEINSLYNELKLLDIDGSNIKSTTKGNVAIITPVASEGKIVFGIAVAKSGTPLGNTIIDFISLPDKKLLTRAVSDKSGKFSTADKLPFGDYMVKLNNPGNKFDSYKITVAKDVSNGYKFRSR